MYERGSGGYNTRGPRTAPLLAAPIHPAHTTRIILLPTASPPDSVLRLPALVGLALVLLFAACDSNEPAPDDALPAPPDIVSGSYSALTFHSFSVRDGVGIVRETFGAVFLMELEFEPGATPRESLYSISVRDSTGRRWGGWARDQFQHLEGEGDRLVLPVTVALYPSDLAWERFPMDVFLNTDTTAAFSFDLRNVFAEAVEIGENRWVDEDAVTVEFSVDGEPPAPADQGEVVWISLDDGEEVGRTPLDLSTLGGSTLLSDVPADAGAFFVRTTGTRDGIPVETTSWPSILPDRWPDGVSPVQGLSADAIEEVYPVPGGFVVQTFESPTARLLALDAETGTLVSASSLPSPPQDVALTPDGQTAWTFHAGGALRRVDLLTGSGSIVGAVPDGTRWLEDAGDFLLAANSNRVHALRKTDASVAASYGFEWSEPSAAPLFNPAADRAYFAGTFEVHALRVDPATGAFSCADSLFTPNAPRLRPTYLLPNGHGWVDRHGAALRSADGPDDLTSYGYFDVDDPDRVGAARFSGDAATGRVVALHSLRAPGVPTVLSVFDLQTAQLLRRLPLPDGFSSWAVTRVSDGYAVLLLRDGDLFLLSIPDTDIG